MIQVGSQELNVFSPPGSISSGEENPVGITGKRVKIPLVAIVHFREGKLAHEHICWDQASVLVQLGLLDAGTLPVAGIETARKALNPRWPSNALIERAHRAK